LIPSNWVFREIYPDYGVDCEVELATTEGELTGDRLFFQVKASTLRRTSFRIPNKTLLYWNSLPAPLIFTFVHVPTGDTRFVAIPELFEAALSRDSVEKAASGTSRIDIRRGAELPKNITHLVDIALAWRIRHEHAQIICNSNPYLHIVFWLVLRDAFDWNLDSMISFIRTKGSREQLLTDLPFAYWVKDVSETDPGYLERSKAILDALEGNNPELRKCLESNANVRGHSPSTVPNPLRVVLPAWANNDNGVPIPEPAATIKNKLIADQKAPR